MATKKIYQRKKFWIAVIAAFLVAAGAAAFFLTKEAGVTLSPSADRTASPATEGQVEIYTSPKGASITVDGKKRREKSPAKFSVPTGKHTVVLKLDDYDTATIQIEVVSSNPAVIQQTFTKQGKITVSQKPDEWGTYTNDQFHYRIRYPDDWEVDADAPNVVNFSNKNRAQGPEAFRLPGVTTALAHGEEQTALTILTQPNPGNLTPLDWYKARPEYSQEDQSQIKTKELTIGGRPAFQYETPYGFVPYVNTIVTGNGQAFIMQQIKDSPERGTYDQVIQTFRLF